MPWYKVIKTIHAHQYLYWQRTYRVGKSVKTENKYIGPASSLSGDLTSSSASVPKAPQPLVSESSTYKTASSFTTTPPKVSPQPDISSTTPRTPEDAARVLRRFTGSPISQNRQRYEKHRQQEIWDNERVQWGSVKSRIQRQAAKVRAAKRKTRGIKAANPFLALVLKRPK